MHVLTQSAFEEPRDPAALAHEPLVVHQRTTTTNNQALLIFVHGLGGRRYGKKATWGQFPPYVYEDFQQLDIGLYTFRTLLGRLKFWESIPLETEAQVFAEIIRDARDYKTIILVGHSMGGLLCMGAICYLLNTHQTEALARLRGLVLMATPQTGSQRVPRILSRFSKDFHALRPHGAFVTRIDDTFVNALGLDESSVIPGKIVIPTWAVLGASDFWVDKLSAGLRLPAHRKKMVRGAHTAVVKPQTKHTDAYRFVCDCIKTSLEMAAKSPERARVELQDVPPTLATIPAELAALERVRRLSEIAAKDARLIAEDPHGVLGGEICLDQQLYVTRSVEQEIHAYLSGRGRRNASWVLVVGEAGYGKTSLLWHFHHLLNASDKWEPWFVKSTSFWRHTSKLSAEELAFAAEATRGQGRRPIVLLDTVDLLLHNDKDRDDLLALLSGLNDRGCFVIATCRPQEASLLRPAEPASVYLGQYDDTELAEAVDKHVARFCTVSAPRQREEHLQRIKDAVARGLPLREVCTNPLTLRMLFTLYAPEEIHPSEINIFKLYQEYWEARVKQDRRAGSPIAPEASTNLETTASGVALAMLAEGTPELDYRLLLQALRELGGSPEDVPALVSRGVLQHSGIGTVSFFHQTFFEHSAARGMLTRLGAQGLAIVDERMQVRPNDPFLSPIYEQALLLSETAIAPIRQKADPVLMDLIQRASHVAKSSGIYVYAHRQRVSDAMVRAVQELLAAGDAAIADRFLEVAPNIAEPRLQTLFEELDIIWNRGQWQEQEHLLDLLERLAARAPEGVLHYLERHDVLSHVLAKPADFPGDRKLLRVLSVLANFDPGWSWAWILQLYAKSLRRARSRTLQTMIINTLCERAAVFGARDIATRFEAASFHAPDTQMEAGVSELSRASGRLWAIQWRASNSPLSDLLHEIATRSDDFGLWARMNGLSELLLTANEDEATLAVAHLRRERETSRQWLWAKFVLPQLLRGNQGPSPPRASPSKRSMPPAVRYVRKEAARILAEWKTDEASNLLILFRHAVELAALPPPTLRELLDSEELSTPAPWLDEERFARLLADAFLAGHQGASQAMALLKEDPLRHKKVVSIVSSRLAEYPPTEPRVADTLIELVLRVEDETRLLRVIRQLAPPVPVVLQQRVQELNAFRQRLVASKSEQKRCRGVSLWIHLLRLELSSPPLLAELRARFEQEKPPLVRAWFADLIGQAAAKGGYDIEMVVDILAPLVKEQDETVREKSFAALMRAITETPGAPPAFALTALDIALTPPTHAGRPRLFGWLIERLLPEHVDIATDLIEKLVSAPGIMGLGSQGKRDIIAYLRSPVRALVRIAPPHVQERLLNTVVHLDRFLGRLIIDAICHEVFAAMAERLNMLLEQDVPGEIKELIRLHKYYRERTVGGEGWPELYNHLR